MKKMKMKRVMRIRKHQEQGLKSCLEVEFGNMEGKMQSMTEQMNEMQKEINGLEKELNQPKVFR